MARSELRHSFGSLAINALPRIEVQQAMSHADLRATMWYLHAKAGRRARCLAAVFAITAEEGSNRAADLTDAA
jgi:integrase